MSGGEGGSLLVRLLGPLEIEFDGRLLGPGDFGGRKPKQVVETLLVHLGQPVPKERIADMVWGDSLPRDPMRTLEAYVSTVRACLHPDAGRAREVLRSEPGAYRLALDDAAVDMWRFDDLVSRAGGAAAPVALELRTEALGLVRGEVLADEPYAEWVSSLRDLYAERHMQLLLDAAEDSLAVARPDLSIGYAEQVLRMQPARERAHRLVMAARYAQSDQDRALAAYERCRRALADELGVSPLEETERLYLAILNHDPVDTVVPRARTGSASSSVTPSRPPTRFAFSGETMVAYQNLGDGPIDVILALGWFSHVEVAWEEHRYARFAQRLPVGGDW